MEGATFIWKLGVHVFFRQKPSLFHHFFLQTGHHNQFSMSEQNHTTTTSIFLVSPPFLPKYIKKMATVAAHSEHNNIKQYVAMQIVKRKISI